MRNESGPAIGAPKSFAPNVNNDIIWNRVMEIGSLFNYGIFLTTTPLLNAYIDPNIIINGISIFIELVFFIFYLFKLYFDNMMIRY